MGPRWFTGIGCAWSAHDRFLVTGNQLAKVKPGKCHFGSETVLKS
jgi:hypothetical protein